MNFVFLPNNPDDEMPLNDKEKDDARREIKKEAKEDFEDFPEASNPQQPGRDAFYSYFPSCSLNVA